MRTTLPLPPLNPRTDALFLDFDGTLTEIVDRPEDARLTSSRAERLSTLVPLFSGAVAVLSGRAVRVLDERLPPGLWRAGGHGTELAGPGASAAIDATQANRAKALAERIQPFVSAADGLVLESKPYGAALHFRARPDLEAACRDTVAAAAREIGGFALQSGKMVVEARPEAIDKGTAMRALCARPPFAGRRPVMVGDDETDEAAMRVACELGGIAVKVGSGTSCAGHRLASPAAVHDWLQRILSQAH